MSCEHSHSHSHSHGDDDHVAPIPTNESQSLRNYVDFSNLTGLNIEQPNDELEKVFKSSEDRFSLKGFIQSDADAQMILNIPFTGYVKLYSVIIRSSGNSDNCPKVIKLFKNKNNLDFDNINDTKPTFKINQPLLGVLDDSVTVSTEDNFVEHFLPRNQFQSTTQLTLFIENNWEDDEDEQTKIYSIEIRGLFQSPLTKDPIITLYESAANPADHKNLLANENKNHSSI